jgi:hypothetical protein
MATTTHTPSRPRTRIPIGHKVNAAFLLWSADPRAHDRDDWEHMLTEAAKLLRRAWRETLRAYHGDSAMAWMMFRHTLFQVTDQLKTEREEPASCRSE